MFWRRHAQRLLVQRGQLSVIPQLRELVRRNEVDSIGLDVGAIHALRTLDGLGEFASAESREVLQSALSHPSSGVVRTAIEVLPRDEAGRDLLLGSDAFESADAQVRLSALLAIAESPAAKESASQALRALVDSKNQNDRWMLDAATSAAATSGGDFLSVGLRPDVGVARIASGDVGGRRARRPLTRR